MTQENIPLQPNEEILPIQGYEGLYSITSFGRVWSHERKVKNGKNSYRVCSVKFLKLISDKDGYSYVNLHMNKKRKTYKVHRIEAQHYIPNLLNLPEINHKDGNKQNNYAGIAAKNYTDGNLEWCTHEKNMSHASINKLYTYKYHFEYYGVSFDKRDKQRKEPWYAQIIIDKKLVWLGYYKIELEAAQIYNNYVVKNKLNRPLNNVGGESKCQYVQN